MVWLARSSLPHLPARRGEGGGGGEASPTIPRPLPRPRPPQDGRTRWRTGPARPGVRDGGDPKLSCLPGHPPPDAKPALQCTAVRTAVRSAKTRPNPRGSQPDFALLACSRPDPPTEGPPPLNSHRWSAEARSPPRGALPHGTPSERTPDPLQAYAPDRAHDGMTDARRA